MALVWTSLGVVLFALVFLVALRVLTRIRSNQSEVNRFARGERSDRPKNLRILFVHPDLGIGGAERLIVDAAVGLQKKGHRVTIFTAHHDPEHCFPETRNELTVEVFGDWLPRHFFRRFQALCAYIRMVYVAGVVVLRAIKEPIDVIICDQVSFCIPVLRLCSCKIVFYCHFPDFLLTHHRGLLKRLYRAPLDWAEETTTGMADLVLVNSKFTAGVFQTAFPRLWRRGVRPEVLYPSVPLDDSIAETAEREGPPDYIPSGESFVLSLNRYERKKNIGLAIETFASLRDKLPKCRLVLPVVTTLVWRRMWSTLRSCRNSQRSWV